MVIRIVDEHWNLNSDSRVTLADLGSNWPPQAAYEVNHGEAKRALLRG